MKSCFSSKNLRRCGRSQGFGDMEGILVFPGGEKPAFYVSRTYDSGEKGTEWNRVVLKLEDSAVFRQYIYLSDDPEEMIRLGELDSAEEQFCYIRDHAQYGSDYRDMLLYGEQNGAGRYARLGLEIHSLQYRERALFWGYEISFPKESFTRYLPEIFRGDVGLERFLAVQQNLYLSLEGEIKGIAGMLDPDLCDSGELRHLAEWMGWGGLTGLVDEETLRRLLHTGTELLSRKGTRFYYEKLGHILTGCETSVAEDPKAGSFILYIKGEVSEEGQRALEFIRQNAPIGIRMEIVVIHNTGRLDNSCFLDYTVLLAKQEQALVRGGIDIEGIRLT